MTIAIVFTFILVAIIIYYRFIRDESNDFNVKSIGPSKYKWSAFIKSNGKIYRSHEDDDLNSLAYKIYINFGKEIDKVEIYIRDNANNKLMKIVTDCSSESMIGVDHPINGHIGYLSFEVVNELG